MHSTTIDGEPSTISIHSITYMPGTSYTLISPQQLLKTGCHVKFDQQHRFQFYLDNQLQLFTYHLYDLPITFTPTPVTISPAATTLSAYSPLLCMDLVHHQLSHTSKTQCHKFIRQSANFTKQEKRRILCSPLSPHCTICLLGKQAAQGMH